MPVQFGLHHGGDFGMVLERCSEEFGDFGNRARRIGHEVGVTNLEQLDTVALLQHFEDLAAVVLLGFDEVLFFGARLLALARKHDPL